jgi:2,4-dienoyl-CoA reductase-like NADH-dependent reductase (Old Yellow Enzyme family)
MTTPHVSQASLFKPFELAGQSLKNRIVHAAMNTHMAANTKVTDQLIQYHANRAQGGAAMIVTEPISMAPHQNVSYRARAWNDDNLDGLKRWADAVVAHDCRLLGQIQDPGRGRHNTGIHADAISASALPDDLSWLMPRALSAAEIRAMIAAFVSSAQRLQHCGFSGVEISGGHGHLFHQFLSPWSNVRADEYGGSVEGRARLIAELISALRSACGAGFIVGLRLPGSDFVPGGIDVAEASRITAHLVRSGAPDYLNFVQGTHGQQLEWHLPDAHGPRLPWRELYRELRKAAPGVPLMYTGRVESAAEALDLIDSRDVELVGLGRPLLADPAWPLKVAQGREHEIRQCIWCNRCWDTINTHLQPMACVVNPRVARADETDWRPAPASQRRRVVVVGAGVAGLEAAWIAAARGHTVTLWGRSSDAGGKARWHAQLPGGEATCAIHEFQFAAARKAGVQFRLGATAGVGDVLALKPDAVVLATGSRMTVPPWLTGGDGLNLREALCPQTPAAGQAGTAVIFDRDHTEAVYDAAEWLHARYARVLVMTPRDSIATATAMVTRQGILRRLYQKHIDIITAAEPCSDVSNGKLEYRNVYNGDRGVIHDVAFFAYATPRIPNDELAAALSSAGVSVRRVGDARSARGPMAAIADGHEAGNTVEKWSS